MDAIFHIVVPFLLLRLFGFRHKFLLPMSLLGIVPDLGRLVGYYKETHSLVFIFVVWAIFAAFVWKMPEKKFLLGAAAFFLISHLFLDLGTPMGLFWPLSSIFYTIKIALQVHNSMLVPLIEFSTALPPGRPGIEYVITSAATGLTLLGILLFFVKARLHKA